MSDDETLYKISIETPTSPEELHEFTDLLEAEGYAVVTDLSAGALEVWNRNE